MLERQAHVRASYVLYLIRFLPHAFLAAYVSYKVSLLTNEFKGDQVDPVFYNIELKAHMQYFTL